jgi:hypothetical protein
MVRIPLLALASLTALLALGACSSSKKSAAAPGDPALAEATPGEGAPAADAPRGPARPETRVTWEALAVERDQAENPRFGRRPQQGAVSQRIVLVNESHEEARATRGRTARTKGDTTVAVVSDEDMELLVRGFQQAGYFGVARPTQGMERLFDDPQARGRITVERDGQSVTIVSMRGQGLAPETKRIPAIYSDLKQAIAMVRNRTPTLNVRTAEVSGRVSPGR